MNPDALRFRAEWPRYGRNMNNKSVISISMHKAGSTIADSIIMDILEEKGMELDRISLQVPASPLPAPEIFKNYQKQMKEIGVYYGIARGPYVSDMPILNKLKVIVQVRDPRDCLTSAYFSFKESHVPPRDPEKLQAFMERRRKLEKLDINEYALTQAGSYKHRLSILRKIVERHDDIRVLKYEDMVEHTEQWLEQIAQFVHQPITPALRTKLGEKLDFSVDNENASKHKRQVSPGDHKRKLSESTVSKVTGEMAEEMAYFGYT